MVKFVAKSGTTKCPKLRIELFIYCRNYMVPDRYTLYRRRAVNWFSQRVILDNSYCNCLAICRYFLENLSQLWINSIYCTHVILFKSLIIVLGLFGLCILIIIYWILVIFSFSQYCCKPIDLYHI